MQFGMRSVFVVAAVASVILAVFIRWPTDGSRMAMERSTCRSNLLLIGAALHSYHDRYGCFPPAFLRDREGTPAHSWRVLLLPFIGGDRVYSRYHFDEPWNGVHNAQLANDVPTVYRCPRENDCRSDAVGHSSYALVLGSNFISPNSRSVALASIEDPERTILVAEVAGRHVPWTQPTEVNREKIEENIPGRAPNNLRGSHSGFVFVVFADGNVGEVPAAFGRDEWRILCSVRGNLKAKRALIR